MPALVLWAKLQREGMRTFLEHVAGPSQHVLERAVLLLHFCHQVLLHTPQSFFVGLHLGVEGKIGGARRAAARARGRSRWGRSISSACCSRGSIVYAAWSMLASPPPVPA